MEGENNNNTSFFGDGIVPFADPQWYSFGTCLSPYYDESHCRVRKAMRQWVQKEIEPFVDEWDDPNAIRVPADLPKKAYEAGWLPTVIVGASELFPDATWIGGVKAKQWTPFHSLVVLDELSRCGSAGVIWNVTGGLVRQIQRKFNTLSSFFVNKGNKKSIGLPPVLHYGSEELKAKVVMPCIRGEKRICLAITEATAGSDLTQIKTRAEKSKCGNFYIVNGQKKWITNGILADFFTVALYTESGIR